MLTLKYLYIHTYIYTHTFIHAHLKNILFIFTEKGKEEERGGEKHQCVVVSHMPPTGDLARNPGRCPDWESNRRPFGLQDNAPPTEPHQPGRLPLILEEASQ